jgi:formylglycine-generating enzyme required for sulfatase activity
MQRKNSQRKLAGIIAAALVVCALATWGRKPALPDAGADKAQRARTPKGMVYVPAGECLIGSDDADADDDARPLRRVFVPAFYVDRTEVTNAEFKRFRSSHQFPNGEGNLPVTNVTYDDAAAYAKWAGKRLPTEEEWEKAARGADGRRYPWGNDWDVQRVAARARRAGGSRVQPVGSVKDGASPYGCLDVAGNAWEWVQGFYQGNRHQRILRGGAVGYGERASRVYARAVEGAEAT